MKKVFALAAFALVGAALSFTACSDDPEASPLVADLSSKENTVEVKGYVYYPQDSAKSNYGVATTWDTLAYAPAGIEILVEIDYSDLGFADPALAGQYWRKTVTTNDKGEFSVKVPVNAQYIATSVDFTAAPFKDKQIRAAGPVDGTYSTATVTRSFAKGDKLEDDLKVVIEYTTFTKYVNENEYYDRQ